LDGSGGALSANLLGTALAWGNLVYGFGPPNVVDVVSCAGQTISVAPGQFNTLQFLAMAINGSQAAQTFTVTYTDNSTATFTQNFSDWVNQQSFAGETRVLTMSYRNRSGGVSQTLNVFADGYVFTLDETKTVKSVTLPADANLILLAMTLALNPAPVILTAAYNRPGIYTDGTAFTNPATGGVDGNGFAYSGTLLGGSQTWSSTLFNFGPFDATNVISCAGQAIPLPAGNYSALRMLAAGVNGNQLSQSFTVTYTDLSTATFVQSFSDWFGPQNYAGETKAIPMGYRNSSNGTSSENNSLYLYGYTFALDPARTIASLQLPSDANVIIAAVSAVPNWPPAFSATDYTLPNATVDTSYTASIAADASDLNGDQLTFAKASGPAWLNVAGDGSLSGTPLAADVGTNTFAVRVTDPWNLSAIATLTVLVQTPAPIVASLINPSGQLLLTWTGGTGPYQVRQATNLDNPVWQNFGRAITGNSISLPSTNSAAFYRIVGQ
jgi:hypothetical protein